MCVCVCIHKEIRTRLAFHIIGHVISTAAHSVSQGIEAQPKISFNYRALTTMDLLHLDPGIIENIFSEWFVVFRIETHVVQFLTFG